MLSGWKQGFYGVSLLELTFPVLGVYLRRDMTIQYASALGIS